MTGEEKRKSDETRLLSENGGSDREQTMRLKTMFPGKTEAEYGKLNRKFLRDAEPFELDTLISEVKKIPEGVLCGFKGLDQAVTLPAGALSLVVGGPKQGKSTFMMNMMLRIARNYRGSHVLYYSYEEPRRDIFCKLINMSGEKPFEPISDLQDAAQGVKSAVLTNLDNWKWKLKTMSEKDLLKFASVDPFYIGLQRFLDVSQRIHVIDTNYDVQGLQESVTLFTGPFRVGAVFIDGANRIRMRRGEDVRDPVHRLWSLLDEMRRFANQFTFPVVISMNLPVAPTDREAVVPDWREMLTSLANVQQEAGLCFGVAMVEKLAWQQDHRSGEDNESPLRGPQYEQQMRVRILFNRNGPEVEESYRFHPALTRLIDSHPD